MIEAIVRRKSIRKFVDRPVERGKLERILRAAMRAPSAMNCQPWEFLVVTDKEKLSRLQGFSPGAHAMPTAPAVVAVLRRPPQPELAGFPEDMFVQSLAACTTCLWLQAVEEGLGVSWMGIAPGVVDVERVSRTLGLPTGIGLFAFVAVGYAAEDADTNPVDRFDSSRIHYENYSSKEQVIKR